ncbi:hypothetical protein DI270_017355 [Microbispora triticiradicis]|uniref:Uncharacterized protein n=1 Tax=Microbispora triticiradicis TaxID=2200763 RepID=A0ABX9LJ57_9ACTN|nr:hypothetical protein [Microbispora triticiradicis]RGA03658.1 hypothetical protein DI270_017355 [Microbispora triticiradicis]GLW22940.1 hypothetical protein Mame01_29830 [Microbispora amethystogenes]
MPVDLLDNPDFLHDRTRTICSRRPAPASPARARHAAAATARGLARLVLLAGCGWSLLAAHTSATAGDLPAVTDHAARALTCAVLLTALALHRRRAARPYPPARPCTGPGGRGDRPRKRLPRR